MTISAGAMILVNGSTAAAVTDNAVGVHPAAGGGGGGGTILLRIPGALSIAAGISLLANGGNGGNAVLGFAGGTYDPGGGGGGGRIKIFSRPFTLASVILSTSGGPGGGNGGIGSGSQDAPAPAAGANGTESFGIIASSASVFTAQTVYVTSLAWTWSAALDFGNARTASQSYRVYSGSGAVMGPFSAPQASTGVYTGPLPPGITETGLAPNTTYYRFVTAFTDWGDSLPSNAVSTHTLAAAPAGAAFTSMADAALTVNWTSGTAAIPAYNPSYTTYEVDRSTASDFSAAVSTSFVAAISSSPAGLLPNTIYSFRVRAVNLDGIQTAFAATMSTATLATIPANPAIASIFVTSASFIWSPGQNPPDTAYLAQISTDNFFSLVFASSTLSSGATFFNLTPGEQYFFRVSAMNRQFVSTAYTAVISATPGILTNTSPPGAPGTPQPDRRYSYDGTAVFSWAPASSPIGILDYFLQIGSAPGASDFFAGSTTTLSFKAAGLISGLTYYAQVRARSNSGVYGPFSSAGGAVSVFVPAQTAPISKPYNWPNPFDPAQGATTIGFFLETPATVTLKIYTLEGRLVYEDSRLYGSAGNQTMAWGGANDNGRAAAPGGYVAVVEKHYADHTDTQKFKIAILY